MHCKVEFAERDAYRCEGSLIACRKAWAIEGHAFGNVYLRDTHDGTLGVVVGFASDRNIQAPRLEHSIPPEFVHDFQPGVIVDSPLFSSDGEPIPSR